MSNTPDIKTDHDIANKINAVEQIEDEQGVRDELSSWTKDELLDYLIDLRKKKAFRREDRLKLQILDQVDFTIWACDSKFEIKLWEGTCEKIYQKKEKRH